MVGASVHVKHEIYGGPDGYLWPCNFHYYYYFYYYFLHFILYYCINDWLLSLFNVGWSNTLIVGLDQFHQVLIIWTNQVIVLKKLRVVLMRTPKSTNNIINNTFNHIFFFIIPLVKCATNISNNSDKITNAVESVHTSLK